ncbi:MAG: outer membrane lipoprotein chaperone LolA [Pasteurellaceae bacterium]|nr:outer membrane lipoprotein chaperone LolA [Pasteurellaceae bacterium]
MWGVSIFTTLLLLVSQISLANTQAVMNLQQRLTLATQYSADFEQVVRSNKGHVIQEGQGKFQVKRPNLFRMETYSPQENVMISDGQTLWFYDPFVAQVTANWVNEAVNDTPFVLLTSNASHLWSEYDVVQDMDSFTLKPKSKKSAIRQFNIRIDNNGVLKGFSLIERDGQSNLYILKNIDVLKIPDVQFQFILPNGVELDDQRNRKR